MRRKTYWQKRGDPIEANLFWRERLDLIITILTLFIFLNNHVCFAESLTGVNANIARNYSDYGVDANKNGLYDFLSVEIGVQVESAGEYSIMGNLCDSSNEAIWSIDRCNLSRGYQNMHLLFDGKSIRKTKYNGRFSVVDLTLISGSSDTKLIKCDYIQNAYATSAYNYSDFEV